MAEKAPADATNPREARYAARSSRATDYDTPPVLFDWLSHWLTYLLYLMIFFFAVSFCFCFVVVLLVQVLTKAEGETQEPASRRALIEQVTRWT